LGRRGREAGYQEAIRLKGKKKEIAEKRAPKLHQAVKRKEKTYCLAGIRRGKRKKRSSEEARFAENGEGKEKAILEPVPVTGKKEERLCKEKRR